MPTKLNMKDYKTLLRLAMVDGDENVIELARQAYYAACTRRDTLDEILLEYILHDMEIN